MEKDNVKKGIILAGGEGKRLAPLGLNVPKPLVPVNGTPLLNFNLGLLGRYGVHDVKAIIRPSDRAIYAKWSEKYAESFPSMKIEFLEEPAPMGTFGYFFHHLRDWMGAESVFVTNGDDIKEIDLGAMAAFHQRAGVPATLALMKMERPDDYGAVLVKEDKVAEFLEKRPGLSAGFVSAGMYLVSPAALDRIAARIPAGRRYLMFEKDLFPALAASGELGAFACEGRFFDCGTPERLMEAAISIRAAQEGGEKDPAVRES